MTSPTRALTWVGVVSSVCGLLLGVVEAKGLSVRAVGGVLRTVGYESFGRPPWLWLVLTMLVAGAAATLLHLTELAGRISRPRQGPSFSHLQTSSVGEAVAEVGRRLEQCLGSNGADIIAAFDQLLQGAVSVSASDIHLSPTVQGLRVTYRVHGTLYEVATLDPAFAPKLATRVKVLARLDTYVRGAPQDGRLTVQVDGGTVEARVSTLPTELGERIVLRLVRGSLRIPELGGLGFSPLVTDGLRELLAKPQGLLFVTGPVGSGKTTTLYSLLEHIWRTRGRTTSLVTLEDPIEIELGFLTQTQMHRKAGMTFASVLRSVLRQDPNVLMLGEIRDHETAEIAMQAGLTGHLILTTVHGEGAAGPFARLVDMNIEPFILASATLGCLSQRLVRTLCTACRRPAQPEQMHVDRFAKLGLKLAPGSYYDPVGCPFCEEQGFAGRAPIAELLVVNARIREAVNQRVTTRAVHELAVAEGMTPLLQDGLERARRGETSLTEVLRVAG
jgi:general secretion pathway protein E